MVDVVFDPCAFRTAFPAVAPQSVSNITLQRYFDTASIYLCKRYNTNCFLNNPRLVLALNLLTAHIAGIAQQISSGSQAGIVTSATIDKVSVTLEPPESASPFAYWLNQTPYGQELLALLSMVSAGGAYYGARPELGAMRRGGGL